MTFCMSSRHSNQLSYAPESDVIISQLFSECKGFSEISRFFYGGTKGQPFAPFSPRFCTFHSFTDKAERKMGTYPREKPARLLEIRPRI